MLIDLHAHTSGISKCCKIDAPGMVRVAKDAGLDGVVLCNHYDAGYVKNGDTVAFARRYVEEYEYARACGEEIGCSVLFGIELMMNAWRDAVNRFFTMPHAVRICAYALMAAIIVIFGAYDNKAFIYFQF